MLHSNRNTRKENDPNKHVLSMLIVERITTTTITILQAS